MTASRVLRPLFAALCSAAFGLVLVSASAAQTPPRPNAAERALAVAEDQLLEAEARKDVAAIQRGFADEALFVHANGATENKSEYIELARGKPAAPGSIKASDRVVRVFGKVGVTQGKLTVTLGEMTLPGLYLGVYIRRDGRWQMLNWQTSPAPRTPANR